MNIFSLIGLIASAAVVAELRHRFEIETPQKEGSDATTISFAR